MPSGITAGDLLLAICASDGRRTLGLSGWTILFNDTDNIGGTGTGGNTLLIAYKIAAGGDSGTLTISSSEETSSIVYRISGHDSATNAPEVVTNVQSGNTPDTVSDPPVLAPAGGSLDYLWFTGVGVDNEDITLVPDNYTDNDIIQNGGTGGSSLGVSWRTRGVAPSENPSIWGTWASDTHIGFTLAVYPSAGGPIEQAIGQATETDAAGALTAVILVERENTAEGGSDGTGVSVGNSGGASGDAWDSTFTSGSIIEYDDDQKFVGNLSIRFDINATQSNYVAWTFADQPELYFRFYARLTPVGIASVNNPIFCSIHDSSGARIMAVYLRESPAAGGVGFEDNQAAGTNSSGTDYDDTTWYRFEGHIVEGPTGSMELRIYEGHGSTPLETLTDASGDYAANGTLTTIRFGANTAQVGTIDQQLWMDDIAIAIDDWIGPSNVIPQAIDQATETGVSGTLAKRKIKAFTRPTETGTAGALTRRKVKAIGRPTETGVSGTLTKRKIKAFARPTETGVSGTLTKRKLKAIGRPTETGVAGTFTKRKIKTFVRPTETGVASTLTRVKRRLLGQATETGVSRQLFRNQLVLIGKATETGTSGTLVRIKRKSFAQATETGVSGTLTFIKRKAFATSTETGVAQTLSRVKRKLLGQVTETEVAGELAIAYGFDQLIIGNSSDGRRIENDVVEALSQ